MKGQKVFLDHNTKLTDERSTAGFRLKLSSNDWKWTKKHNAGRREKRKQEQLAMRAFQIPETAKNGGWISVSYPCRIPGWHGALHN